MKDAVLFWTTVKVVYHLFKRQLFIAVVWEVCYIVYHYSMRIFDEACNWPGEKCKIDEVPNISLTETMKLGISGYIVNGNRASASHEYYFDDIIFWKLLVVCMNVVQGALLQQFKPPCPAFSTRRWYDVLTCTYCIFDDFLYRAARLTYLPADTVYFV